MAHTQNKKKEKKLYTVEEKAPDSFSEVKGKCKNGP